jgi:hypothetical protein
MPDPAPWEYDTTLEEELETSDLKSEQQRALDKAAREMEKKNKDR